MWGVCGESVSRRLNTVDTYVDGNPPAYIPARTPAYIPLPARLPVFTYLSLSKQPAWAIVMESP